MKLTLNYKHPQDYLPTDIAQLRPQGSYKQLISKRNHPIEHLIATYGKIPEDLLIRNRSRG